MRQRWVMECLPSGERWIDGFDPVEHVAKVLGREEVAASERRVSASYRENARGTHLFWWVKMAKANLRCK